MTTPTLADAARMALDAPESLQGGCTDSGDGTVEAITVWCPEVIEALRAALSAAPAAAPVAHFSPVTVLPDGSAFATASFPLPADHWLTAPQSEWDSERDELAECPRPILTNAQRDAVKAAARYAIRGATMRGQEADFDPDALVLNMVYALCGPVGGATMAADAPPVAQQAADPTPCVDERRAYYRAFPGAVPPDDEARWVGWQARAALATAHAQQQAATVQPLSEAQIDELRGLDTAQRVRFYEHDFYVLSNFSAFSIKWQGRKFPTSEHAYHWEKFAPGTKDKNGFFVRDRIIDAWSAHEAFKMAERWKPLRRADWDAVKVNTMRGLLRAKADQHEYVRRKLLDTGDRELVEDSWRDDFWGWGPDRTGQNMLGRLWMEVRSELRGITATQQAPTDTKEQQ